jgi:hypothetical protein
MVLPEPPSNPDTRRAALGECGWGGALAAAGVIDAMRAALNNSSLRVEVIKTLQSAVRRGTAVNPADDLI